MAGKEDNKDLEHIGSRAAGFIGRIVSRMGYRRKVQMDVKAELASHFEDEIKGAASEAERNQRIEKLIAEFGDIEQLAVLLRRAKKRCRPLWAKVILRSLQCVGLLVLSFVIYTAWFVSGEPNARVDYLAMINDMSRPEILEQDNAWPHYEKAIEMLVEPSESLEEQAFFKSIQSEEYKGFGKLAASEQDVIEQWLVRNEEAWQEFVAGSSKSYCYRQYGHDPNSDPEVRWLMHVLLPHLQPTRTLAKVGIWRARVAVHKGDVQEALADCMAIARVGGHWQSSSTLVEQLVGATVSSIARLEIIDIVASGKMSGEQLNSLQQELSDVHADGYPLADIKFERLAFLDIVQNAFTDGGPGGGHLLPGCWELINDFSFYVGEDDRIILWPIQTAASMVHAGRKKTVARFEEIFEDALDVVKMTPHAVHVVQLDPEKRLWELPRYRYSLIRVMMPALTRVGEICFRGKLTHEATLMMIGLERWRLDKGGYPDSAGELVSGGYLAEVPVDPFSDRPLAYRKTADGFTLYSFGPDFKDDGGKPSVDRKGRPQKWLDGGDTVFWPVEMP